MATGSRDKDFVTAAFLKSRLEGADKDTTKRFMQDWRGTLVDRKKFWKALQEQHAEDEIDDQSIA
ncbi:hypothetical protein BGX31_006290, partial [Mortierella sp. GBA43]